MSSMQLREIEKGKTECAKIFFAELNTKLDEKDVRYEVIGNYRSLLQIVS